MKQYLDVVQDASGRALYNASIVVTSYPLDGSAVIYSDNGITVIAGSTVTTDNSGTFSFWAENGSYILTVTYQGNTVKTLSPVIVFDGTALPIYLDQGLSADAIVANPEPAYTSFANISGIFSVQVAYSNATTTPTLTVNGLATKNIVLTGDNALATGYIIQGNVYQFYYEATYDAYVLVNPALPAIIGFASIAGVQGNAYNYASDSGSANTIEISLTPTLTAYALGQKFLIQVANTSTGNFTLNVDSVGAIDVYQLDQATKAGAGAVIATGVYEFAYVSSSIMVLLNPSVLLVPSAAFAGALVYLATPANVASGTAYKVAWDTDIYKTDSGMHSTSTHPSRLICTANGYARFTGAVSWSVNTLQVRDLVLTKNGSGTSPDVSIETNWAMTSTTQLLSIISPIFQVSTSDYFELVATQNSGGDAVVEGIYFQLEYVG